MFEISQFKEAIQSAGLIPPELIEPGKFYRFPGEGKGQRNAAGWCKLFDDGLGGIFGDYSSGLSTDWQAKRATPYSQAEREAFKRQIADTKRQREAEELARHAEAATKAAEIWQTALRSGEYHPAMESHLSKYRKLVPAVALVCALADGESEVSRDSLLRALAWSDYLQTHAARAYTAGTRPATEGATALLAKIKADAVEDGFKPADVYLKGWSHLGTPEAVHAAASLLCDLHHLRRNETAPGNKGGRPSTTYQINPATMGATK